jgi:hypothetical protein
VLFRVIAMFREKGNNVIYGLIRLSQSVIADSPVERFFIKALIKAIKRKPIDCIRKTVLRRFTDKLFAFSFVLFEGEENFVGDSEIIALGGASNETKDRPLG